MPVGTINSTSYVNLPPDILGEKTIALLNRVDTIYTIAMFTTETTPIYHDPEGDPILSIRVDSLPAEGELQLSGSPVIMGQVIDKVSIDNTLFAFISPDQDGIAEGIWGFSAMDTVSGQFSATGMGQITMDVAAKASNTLIWDETVISSIRSFMELTNASTVNTQDVTITWTLTAINAAVGAYVYVPVPIIGGAVQQLFNVSDTTFHDTVISQSNQPLYSMDFVSAEPGDTATFEMAVTSIEIDAAPAIYPITFTKEYPSQVVGGISSTTDISTNCSLTIDSTASFDLQVPGFITVGDQVYSDVNWTTPFVGNGDYYHFTANDVIAGNYSAQIDASGIIGSPISICP